MAKPEEDVRGTVKREAVRIGKETMEAHSPPTPDPTSFRPSSKWSKGSTGGGAAGDFEQNLPPVRDSS